MWNEYTVTLKMTGQLMGGIPKNVDVIKSWLEARMPTYAPPDAISIPDLAEQVAQQVQATSDAEDKVWTGFKTDDENGLYVDGSNLKAHLKDLANILKDTIGVKALKAKVADRVFVVENRLYFGKLEPDGFWEHAVHIMTMQGPRSALKRNDYVNQPTITAHLKVLDDKLVTEEMLTTLLEYGSVKGFGAERGLGHGRYKFTITKD